MKVKFEDFKNEIEKIYDRFSVKRYDKDQVVMIGLTLQNRRANDIDIFIDEDISAFRITTDDDGDRLFNVEIGFDVDSLDILSSVLDLTKKYMQEEK
ncbi:hypothetical protein [Ligilactobacillus salivarius]|uniref:Uncharacterized protein n=1 Tax=Ligilactobacillus salivarius TaxID=1624 RepID=A0A089QGM4_9LACO|nr:hypothetical protein [Ligilactobacillus salivarius]AIR11830.1 Hypothetical protein LSJ_4053 [Ligilactobacillus salivarius]OQQ89320.1 hypothetical protein B6U56_09160 [Ligilactobacillus salivarius]